MINKREEFTIDSNFVLDMSCDIEDGKTLRGTLNKIRALNQAIIQNIIVRTSYYVSWKK